MPHARVLWEAHMRRFQDAIDRYKQARLTAKKPQTSFAADRPARGVSNSRSLPKIHAEVRPVRFGKDECCISKALFDWYIPRLSGNPKKSLANQFCRDSDPFHDPRRLS
jgi:hypothetical protein